MEELRPKARRKVRELIAMPAIDKKPEIKQIKSYLYDGLHIDELRWQLPYGPPTEAVFMKPVKSDGTLPGIVALHDHGGVKYFGKGKIMRTGDGTHPLMLKHQKDYYGDRALANEIAKRGYGVLIHDIFPFESRRIISSDIPGYVVSRMMQPPLQVQEMTPEDLLRTEPVTDFEVSGSEGEEEIAAYNSFGEQHEHIIAKGLFSSGLTWPGFFIAEDLFALDYLCSRPDIDRERVGCCGLSGGGLRTNLLAGLDDRIRCSVTAGFMTTWRDFAVNVNYTHTWMIYVPLLPGFMDYPEILGMRAPLPSLVLATDRDPLFSLGEVKRAADILKNIYAKTGAEDSFRFSLYRGPHKFDVPMQEEAFQWFDRWIG
jgi:dienelactone hydrolase